MESKRKWAKYRSDFPPLRVRPLHLDLHFDVRDERVVVTQAVTLRNETKEPMATVEMDAKNLIDLTVKRYHTFSPLGDVKNGGADFPAHVQSFKDLKEVKAVDVQKEKVVITLETPVKAGAELVLLTKNTVKPTANLLEGIYYDFTLPGKPKTMITQCQQYGFQRICPAVDRMSAKAFYTTTIVADKRYTNLISNGDLAQGYYRIDEKTGSKIAVYQPSGDRKEIKYYNHLVNMASYLFFLGVGVYETYTKTLEYPDGDTIDLQLLSLPAETELTKEQRATRTGHYEAALEALHASVQWCYLSTGPEACEHKSERSRIKELLVVRDALKDKVAADPKQAGVAEELGKVRGELKSLISKWTNTGYKYTGQTYREIGMQNSNYGGMENVGNTTILQSRLAPTDLISDGAYMYMEAVKIHEFYHNINGSQVTGYSPFEIWLNEAVTVHMERKRSAEIFGDGHIRLQQVARAFIPGTGPLATDSGPRAMPVEPEGFNITNELITGMTYFKAPEFVRMVEVIMGDDLFNKGLHKYHETYKNANATSIQWIEAMENTLKEAGKPFSLKKMAHGWLKRSYHPHVKVSMTYDDKDKKVVVSMTQSGFEKIKQTMAPEEKGGPWDIGADFKAPWTFPVEWALVSEGKNIKEGTYIMAKASESFEVTGVSAKPDFISFARGFSFFGTYTVTTATTDNLALQACTDTDLVNRFLAYRAIAEAEKARLVELKATKGQDLKTADVSKEYRKAHAAIMFDDRLQGMAKALICMEPESVDSRPDLAHQYWYISQAKTTMLAAVYDDYEKKVLELFDVLEAANKPGPLNKQLHDRALKGHCLRLMVAGTSAGSDKKKATENASKRAQALIDSAFMSDRIRGVVNFLELQEPKARDAKIAELKKSWGTQMDSAEELIGCISSLDCDDSHDIIARLIEDKMFDINLAGHARRVVRNWAHNRKRCILTKPGLEFTGKLMVTVAKVNQMSAYALLDAFGDLNKFDDKQKASMIATLKTALAGLDPAKETSMCNQIKRLIN